MVWHGHQVDKRAIGMLAAFSLICAAPARANAQYAGDPVVIGEQSEPSYVDPHLVAGATLAGLGTASMVASGVLLGTDDEMLCAMRNDCAHPQGRVPLGIGLFVGGATAAVIGTGFTFGAHERRRGYRQDNAMIAGGGVLTGLCAAGLVGAIGSTAYAMWAGAEDDHGEGWGIMGGLGATAAAGATCGLGIPLWLSGIRPDDDGIQRARRRVPKSEAAKWPVRSRTQQALGS